MKLLTVHPDKGGDPDDFRHVRRAWEVLASRGKVARGPAAPAMRSTKRQRTKVGPRRKAPTPAPPTPARMPRVMKLSSVLQPNRAQDVPVTFKGFGRKRPSEDLFDTWRAELLSSVRTRQLLMKPPAACEVKGMFDAQPSFTDAGSIRNAGAPMWEAEGVKTAAASAARALRQHRSVSQSPWASRGSKRRGASTRAHKSQAPKNTAAEGRAAARNLRKALDQHVRAERAAAAAARAGGGLPEARCPMLARHLHAERAAAAAAAAGAATGQGQACSSQGPCGAVAAGAAGAAGAGGLAEPAARPAADTGRPGADLAALAARIRAAPRAERRSLLEALPLATRRALEQHILAERAALAAAGSGFSSSAGAVAASSSAAGVGAREACSSPTASGAGLVSTSSRSALSSSEENAARAGTGYSQEASAALRPEDQACARGHAVPSHSSN